VTIDGAQGILFNVTGGSDLSLYEINQAAAIIRETAHPDVNLIFGAVIDESMQDELRITVIATGFEHQSPLLRHMVDRRAPARKSNNRPTAANGGQQLQGVPAQPPQRESKPEQAFRVNDMDIPAFLRKNR
jgi:cell division protein FtsZ